jgi:hypothetical protein
VNNKDDDTSLAALLAGALVVWLLCMAVFDINIFEGTRP